MGRTATACTKNIILQKRKVLIFLNTNKCNISECNTSTLQNTDVLRCQKIFASQFFCKQAFTVKDLLTTTAQGGSFPKHTDSPKRHLKLQIITSNDFKKKNHNLHYWVGTHRKQEVFHTELLPPSTTVEVQLAASERAEIELLLS